MCIYIYIYVYIYIYIYKDGSIKNAGNKKPSTLLKTVISLLLQIFSRHKIFQFIPKNCSQASLAIAIKVQATQ